MWLKALKMILASLSASWCETAAESFQKCSMICDHYWQSQGLNLAILILCSKFLLPCRGGLCKNTVSRKRKTQNKINVLLVKEHLRDYCWWKMGTIGDEGENSVILWSMYFECCRTPTSHAPYLSTTWNSPENAQVLPGVALEIPRTSRPEQ